MKKAGVLFDLQNDRVRVKGSWVNLITLTSDHYGLSVLPKSEAMIMFKGLIKQGREEEETDNSQEESEEECHLKDAGIWMKDILLSVNKIHKECNISKQFTKTPSSTVVSMIIATELGRLITKKEVGAKNSQESEAKQKEGSSDDMSIGEYIGGEEDHEGPFFQNPDHLDSEAGEQL